MFGNEGRCGLEVLKRTSERARLREFKFLESMKVINALGPVCFDEF